MIRYCKYCGKPFDASGTQVYCNGPHYATCIICGKQFEVNPKQPKQCCSRECSAKLRSKHIASKTKICKLCGKEFHPRNNTSIYCDGPHYKPCPVCGKTVEVRKGEEYLDTTRCCSVECSNKLRSQTCIEKYGVDIVSKNIDVRKKLHDSAIAAEPERIQRCMDKYGVPNVAMNPDIRKKISFTVKSKSCIAKTHQTMNSRYGVDYAMQNDSLYKKQCDTRKGIYASDGTKVDSSYELAVYEFFLRNHIDFIYQYPIEFDYDGSKYRTYIDFKLDDFLLEVKGAHLLGGCFDYAASVPIEQKLKVYADNDVIVCTDSSMFHLFIESTGRRYAKTTNLIGLDIALFNNPTFPYDESKPRCFYDVEVNRRLSAHDGFFDEATRWKMMLNRIEYVGGFINNKSILTAMNVTKTCSQPSWFSKKLAKYIISKYCTSDTIVDPFAGWGTRHDAAIELDRKYIGIDANEELVKYHRRMNRNINFGDAKSFKYLDNCSVFICPPYKDSEIYFENQDITLDECDWLDIVINNIPNASEYVMVCKNINDKYSKFIVETIQKSSHLGESKEYIVVVHN